MEVKPNKEDISLTNAQIAKETAAQKQDLNNQDIPIKFPNELDQAQFTKIYQTLISLSPFGIAQDSIFEVIAELTTGKILQCENNWCSHDIFILNGHSCDGEPNRPKPKPRHQTVSYGDGKNETYTYYDPPDPKLKIPDHSYNDTQFNQKYYYDPEVDVAYCYECRKTMKLCCSETETGVVATGIFGRSKGRTCGFIFDEEKSYTICSCGHKYKMCLNHVLCKKCNHPTCGSYGSPDFCEINQCGTCSFVGCGSCVIMAGCDMVLDSYPPQYVNPEYKCSGQCMDAIETIFDDNKDYIEFRGIYDALEAEFKSILKDDIIIQIAEFSTGKILNCSNSKCDGEILKLNAHKEEKGVFTDSQYPNIKYFFQKGWREKDKVFCNICREIVGRCCSNTYSGYCTGIFMKDDDTTYNECGCKKKAKLCLKHKPCPRCNTFTCDNKDGYSGDYHNSFICGSARCQKCKYIGCTNCIDRRNKQCKDDGCSKEKPKQQNNNLPFDMVQVSYN